MSKKAPQIAHISKALLAGDVLTIFDGYKRFRVTNLPREISRSIERKFGVVVSKDRVDFTHECGLPGWYYRYRLNPTQANAEGIEKMSAYCEEYFPKQTSNTPFKTESLF